MTILEELAAYSAETPLKIGSRGGTRFFYVGTVGDVRDNIDDYDDLLFDHLNARVQRAKVKLAEAKAADSPAVEELTDILSKRRAALKKFRPLRERKVLECKMSDPIADKGVLRIIVEGNENGYYWSSDERKDGMPMILFSVGVQKWTN